MLSFLASPEPVSRSGSDRSLLLSGIGMAPLYHWSLSSIEEIESAEGPSGGRVRVAGPRGDGPIVDSGAVLRGQLPMRFRAAREPEQSEQRAPGEKSAEARSAAGSRLRLRCRGQSADPAELHHARKEAAVGGVGRIGLPGPGPRLATARQAASMLCFERVAAATRTPPGSRHALGLEEDVRACRRRGADRGPAVVRPSAGEGQQHDDRSGAGGKRESSGHGTPIVRRHPRRAQPLAG